MISKLRRTLLLAINDRYRKPHVEEWQLASLETGILNDLKSWCSLGDVAPAAETLAEIVLVHETREVAVRMLFYSRETQLWSKFRRGLDRTMSDLARERTTLMVESMKLFEEQHPPPPPPPED